MESYAAFLCSYKKPGTNIILILVIILLMINMFAAKEYIFQASKQYSDDIPIYSVECERGNAL